MQRSRLKKRKRNLLRKREGAVEAVILCSVLLLCLVGITVYSLQLRVAKNEKYMVDNAVIAAATSTLVTDLYQYATTEENVLDCTGDAYSNGLYEQPLEATKEACKVAYGRFPLIFWMPYHSPRSNHREDVPSQWQWFPVLLRSLLLLSGLSLHLL